MKRTIGWISFVALSLMIVAPRALADERTDANRTLVRRFLEEVWNNRHLELCDQLIAADAVGHYGGHDFPAGPAAAAKVVNHWRTALTGFHFTIADIFAEGDRVAVHNPFTGNVAVDEILICRVRDDKIAEFWEVFDESGMRKQLTETAPAAAPK